VKDIVITADSVPPFSLRAFVGTFWVSPIRHPSFAWAWWSRLFIFFGLAAVQSYQTFYLLIALHFSTTEVAGAIFLATLVLSVASVALAPFLGRLSDRVGRRKPFVIVAALIFASGLLIVTFATNYPTFLVAMAVIGLGLGVYLAVDLALVTEVLPDQNDTAKDMGIMGLAGNLPQSIVPALAPLILTIGASAVAPQNFAALFITGAVAGLLGALFILPIRGVR
jgi:MFS family permease